jgi:hypothetical protein
MSSIAAGTSAGSALVSTGDTTGALQLQVNGTTPSVTLAANGSIGVGSTPAYGTSGQVLTSSGTGSAPTWTSLPATPGATTQYSLIQGSSADPLLIKPTDLATGAFTTGTFQKTATNYIANTGIPVWSSYYNLWFTLTPYDNTATIVSLFSSANGVTWRLVFLNIYDLTAAPSAGTVQTGTYGGAKIAVDETNGRIFIVFRDSSANVRVLYSDPTSIVVTTGWTSAVILASSSANVTIKYVKMATTGASGMVVYFTDSSIAFQVYTCSAGSTTFTQRYTASVPAAITGSIKYEDSGKIAIYLDSSERVIYTTSGNITTGWTQNTNIGSTAPSGRLGDVGAGYFVSLYDSREIMYSTTGAGTWTRVVLSTGDNQIATVVFMGTFWAAFCNTGTVYTTATTNPSLTWTPTTGAQLNRAVYTMGTSHGKRIY